MDAVLMKLDWLVSFEHCKHTAGFWFLQIFNKTLTLLYRSTPNIFAKSIE